MKNHILNHAGIKKFLLNVLAAVFTTFLFLFIIFAFGLVGASISKINEVVVGFITANRTFRFLFLGSLSILCVLFYALVIGMFLSVLVKDIIRNVSFLSWKQKEKMEEWAFRIGASGFVVLVIVFGFKFLLRAKI